MARILVVDDEEMDRLVVLSALEGLGHELQFAPDGEWVSGSFRRSTSIW